MINTALVKQRRLVNNHHHDMHTDKTHAIYNYTPISSKTRNSKVILGRAALPVCYIAPLTSPPPKKKYESITVTQRL